MAAPILSLPDDVLFIIFGFFYAHLKHVKYRVSGVCLEVPLLPDGLQLLMTCRRLRDYGLERWLKECTVFITKESGRVSNASAPTILTKCPWGAASLVVEYFDEPHIIRKMCQRFSLLCRVQWLTSVHIRLEPYGPLSAKLQPPGLLLVLRRDPTYRAIAKRWMYTLEHVTPDAYIEFKITRQVCCRENAKVAHVLCGKFVLQIKGGECILHHGRGRQLIYSQGFEGCTCTRKYKSPW